MFISCFFKKIVLIAVVFCTAGCISSRIAGRAQEVRFDELMYVGSGKSSFYSDSFDGQKTASGEIYESEDYTAAHPTLPFGTVLLVKRRSNSRFVLVRVNDRGPFMGDRRIDLSRAAAAKLGILLKGVSAVDIYIVPERSTLAAML